MKTMVKTMVKLTLGHGTRVQRAQGHGPWLGYERPGSRQNSRWHLDPTVLMIPAVVAVVAVVAAAAAVAAAAVVVVGGSGGQHWQPTWTALPVTVVEGVDLVEVLGVLGVPGAVGVLGLVVCLLGLLRRQGRRPSYLRRPLTVLPRHYPSGFDKLRQPPRASRKGLVRASPEASTPPPVRSPGILLALRVRPRVRGGSRWLGLVYSMVRTLWWGLRTRHFRYKNSGERLRHSPVPTPQKSATVIFFSKPVFSPRHGKAKARQGRLSRLRSAAGRGAVVGGSGGQRWKPTWTNLPVTVGWGGRQAMWWEEEVAWLGAC